MAGKQKETASGATVATSVWSKSVAVQRAYALWPQFAYMLLVDGFQSHRRKRCNAVASVGAASFRGTQYACLNSRDAKDLGSAPDSRLDELRDWLDENDAGCPGVYSYDYDYGADAACGVDGAYSVYPGFYSQETGQPRAQVAQGEHVEERAGVAHGEQAQEVLEPVGRLVQ